MSYSMVIPPDLVRELYFIREETKISIRKQILQSIEKHINLNTARKVFNVSNFNDKK